MGHVERLILLYRLKDMIKTNVYEETHRLAEFNPRWY
jgi:hypothetical protein